jgi:hypothetical protein
MEKQMVMVECPICIHCKEGSFVKVDAQAFDNWKNRVTLIQDAFPELNAEQRELLQTGIHAECWTEMFGKEE